jgi:hypothetical protein
MNFSSLIRAALAASFFLAPAIAQIQTLGGPDADRKASMLIFAEMTNGFTPHGAVAINYSQPEWKADYDKVLASGKFNGTTQRLGKNWWTSLDTTIALEIGGTKVEAGSYFLGLQIGKDGAPSLLLIDAKSAMQHGWLPFVTADWKTDTVAKLELHKDALAESQAKMTIAITADKDDTSKGKLSIQWGKHELSAAVAFHMHGKGDAKAAPKGEAKGHGDTKGAEKAHGEKN